MSGIDAIRGFDYQISYTLFLIISFMKNEVDKIEKFKFESLTEEEEEDFNIFYKIGTREYIQIKKKDEIKLIIYTLSNLFHLYFTNLVKVTCFFLAIT